MSQWLTDDQKTAIRWAYEDAKDGKCEFAGRFLKQRKIDLITFAKYVCEDGKNLANYKFEDVCSFYLKEKKKE